MQIFHTCLYYHLLFVHVLCNPAFTSDVRAAAWLSVLDGKDPTVLGNDIDTGVKPTEDILFHRFKYFFQLMVACEPCNDQTICLFYYYNYYRSLPNFCLKKNSDLIGFFKIKPRHPDGLTKPRRGWKKNSNGSPGNNVKVG